MSPRFFWFSFAVLVAAFVYGACGCSASSVERPHEAPPVVDPYYPTDCIGGECAGAGGQGGEGGAS